MGIPGHISCHLRNPYTGEEATVKTRHGITNWFKTEKGVGQGCLQSSYLTYTQSTSFKMPGCIRYKLETRLPGEISITSDKQTTPPSWQKAKRN